MAFECIGKADGVAQPDFLMRRTPRDAELRDVFIGGLRTRPEVKALSHPEHAGQTDPGASRAGQSGRQAEGDGRHGDGPER